MVDSEPLGTTQAEHFFDFVELPQQGPVHLAVALPGAELRALPGFPPAAAPESGRVASGRGLTAALCRRSCLGEAVELASCCAWGDEPLVRARESELDGRVLSPEALNGFSVAQLTEREAWNAAYGRFDWRPTVRDPDQAIDWLPVEDAFGGPGAYVPADFAFIGRKEAGDESAVAIGDSNGCAAGETLEDAKLAAVLELIERDATGRWWYGRDRRPPIDPVVVGGAGALTRWLAERRRRTWLFDITAAAVAVPVLAAVSAEPDGREVALGFAAQLEWQAAAVAALTEMAQMEHSLALAALLGAEAGSWGEWRRTVTLATAPLDAALAERPNDGPDARTFGNGSLINPLDRCAAAGIDLWFAEMARTAFASWTVRALSTALTHYKPRLAQFTESTRPGNWVPLLM